MAQLKDLIVNGRTRLNSDTFVEKVVSDNIVTTSGDYYTTSSDVITTAQINSLDYS